MAGQVFTFLVAGNAPIKGIVLRIAFAKRERHFGFCKLVAEIERVRTVAINAKLGIELERIARNMVALARIDMHALLTNLNPEVIVAHLGGADGDLGV